MISKEDVRYVAQLARLELTPQEIDVFTGQLGTILEYAGQIANLEAEKVPPTAHALPLTNVFRKDEVRPSLAPEEALAAAPEREDDAFVVPRIV